MPWIEIASPRPAGDADELGQSRAEQWIELAFLAGLIGRRAIRRRLDLVRAAKAAVGGRTLTRDELDAVLPPVDCARERARQSITIRNRPSHYQRRPRPCPDETATGAAAPCESPPRS